MTVPTVGATGADPFADLRLTGTGRPELKQEMDKELFLELLVASVKYQDPSEPMKTQELVQQTTALSQMEQMLAMTKVTQAQYALAQRTAAASLIGAEVEYVDGGARSTAVVGSVRIENENIFVEVGGKEVALTDVMKVSAPGGAQAGAQAGAQGGAPAAPQQAPAAEGAPSVPAPAAEAAPAAPAPAAPAPAAETPAPAAEQPAAGTTGPAEGAQPIV